MSILDALRRQLLGQAAMMRPGQGMGGATQGLIGTGGQLDFNAGLLSNNLQNSMSATGSSGGLNIPPLALLGSAIYSQGVQGKDPFAALLPAYGSAQAIENAASKNALNRAAIKKSKTQQENLKKLMDSDLISNRDKMFLSAGLTIPKTDSKLSTFTKDAINAGFPPGSPEYQKMFIQNYSKSKGLDIQFNADGSIGAITSGGASDLDILKQKKEIPIQIKNEDTARKLKTTYGTLETIITGMQNQVDNTPTGAVGGLISGLDYVKDQFAQVKDLTVPSSFAGKAARDADKFLADSGISKKSQDYARFKSSAINLAYLLAEVKEPGNPKYSEGDIERQFARFRLGGSRGQIKAALQQVLEDEYRIAAKKYKGLMPEGDFGYTMEGVDLDYSTVDTQNDKKKKDILGYFEQ
jgi:hypothetical protein